MYIEPKENKEFELAEEGQYDTVLIDIVDLGLITSTYAGVTKTQRKLMFVWQAQETDSQGNPYRFFKRFTASLHPKSNLFEAIKKIVGAAPTKGYELDQLIGTNSKLDVEHQTNESTGKTYSVVSAILRLKTRNIPIPTGFVRKQDQVKTAKPVKPAQTQPVRVAPEQNGALEEGALGF